MEINKLPTVVLMLVLVGLIVGVGVLVFDKFGDAVKDSTTVAYGAENVSLLGGAGTLTNDEVTSLLFLGNTTVNFTVGTQVNLTDGEAGTILATYPVVANGSYFVSYVYDADSSATTNLATSATAVGGIASNWMGLIVTIVVLAIILFFVISSFGAGATRK